MARSLSSGSRLPRTSEMPACAPLAVIVLASRKRGQHGQQEFAQRRNDGSQRHRLQRVLSQERLPLLYLLLIQE
jgi:hypothetical protein